MKLAAVQTCPRHLLVGCKLAKNRFCDSFAWYREPNES